jgi:hypothetical protein
MPHEEATQGVDSGEPPLARFRGHADGCASKEFEAQESTYLSEARHGRKFFQQ